MEGYCQNVDVIKVLDTGDDCSEAPHVCMCEVRGGDGPPDGDGDWQVQFPKLLGLFPNSVNRPSDLLIQRFLLFISFSLGWSFANTESLNIYIIKFEIL